jgi:hypothetical protein
MYRVLGILMILLASCTVWAQSTDEHFEKKIRPLFVEHCYSCHSDQSKKSKGGLKLDSAVTLKQGGDTGPAIVPHKPAESLLIKAVRRKHDDVSPMPPTKPLSEQQIADLEKWIADGAYYPQAQTSQDDPLKHWAFQQVTSPAIPNVVDAKWPRNDVDRFLLARMESAKLKPAADASSLAVARRLSFALTGLPPTLDDLKQIEAGLSLSNYVDRLLASPHYGERWARHWMDLVRYADSAGQEYDYEFQGAWRYRDYLVRAFNSDLPYQQLVKEHLAGDLMPPRIVKGRNESLLGVGWWQLQEQATAPVDLANDEAERLDNQIDVLGKTFNALTVGCARCHDHKFDPMRTKEYYGVFGIAASSPGLRAWANESALEDISKQLLKLRKQCEGERRSKPVDVPAISTRDATLFADLSSGVPAGWSLRGDAEVINGDNASLRGLQPGLWSGTLSKQLPAYVRSPQFTLDHEHIDVLVAGEDATVQVVIANYQMIRDPIYNGLKQSIKKKDLYWLRFHVGRWRGKRVHIEVFTGKVDGSHRIMHTVDTAKSQFGLRAVVLNNGKSLSIPADVALDAQEKSDFAAKAVELEKQIPKAERFIAIQDVEGSDVPVYARGDANKPRSDKEPRKFFAIAQVPHESPGGGSGRRELAEVIASTRNPLTARVFVNRVWHHLFGQALVPTLDNFGLLGEKPSHPELLDYLSHRFMHVHQWSVKKLIREIVTSHAFAIASGPAPESDARNTLISRFPLKRLEAEAIRDVILAVSGKLDHTLGGEPIPVPHQLADTGSDSGNNTPKSGPIDGARRRSIYLAVRRNFRSTFLEVFDMPAALNTFGKRDVSNVPTQALTLLNDPFVQEQAKAWAERIQQTNLSDDERIVQMFREALSRSPTESELKMARNLIKDGLHGWHDLAVTLFNVKEFLYVP